MPRSLLLCCLLALLAVPSADAKPIAFRLCGQTGCEPLAAVTGQALAGLYGSRLVSPSGAPAPYYELRGFGHGREIGRWAYVPSAHAVWHHGGSTWTRLVPAEEARWRRAVRGFAPYPAPIVRRATVGGRPVADPGSYLALFGATPRVTPFSGGALEIVLASARSTPWTGPDAAVAFYPREGVLTTGGLILVLAPALAERVRRGQSLRSDS